MMGFAAIYHAHHGQYTEDLPFWLELAAAHEGPALELGCGTGRVLLPLRQAGIQVVGLDNDLDMLRHLKQGGGMAAQVFLAEMTDFHLAQRFGLVLLPCNTLSTLAHEERLRAFEQVRAHLREGGVFAASLPNPLVMRNLPRKGEEEVEELLEHPETGGPLQVSSAWVRSKEDFTVTWFYDHLRPDGMVERLEARVRHDLAPLETYQAELEQAGLRLQAVYGDFDRSAYGEEADNLILVAERELVR